MPTFLDHVRELQVRLFFVGLAYLVSGGVAYLFIDKIVNLIVAPLGKNIQLVYLSPGGAFNFLIQSCLYVGVIGALPMIVYQIYRFVMPVVTTVSLRRALRFTVLSCLLAGAGVAFAYMVILPAALYFLTNFNLYHINPMLTIDSYFSFVMTYLIVGAMLFQLPLIMMLINSIKPLTPGGLMRAQPHIILGSFIVAAVISPTPDALNQVLLASPIVVMYQAGIIAVWVTNRSARRKRAVRGRSEAPRKIPQIASTSSAPRSRPIQSLASQLATAEVAPQPEEQIHFVHTAQISPRPQTRTVYKRSIDGISPRGAVPEKTLPTLRARSERSPVRVTERPQRRIARSLDGFVLV